MNIGDVIEILSVAATIAVVAWLFFRQWRR
jgi:hypothetical protein